MSSISDDQKNLVVAEDEGQRASTEVNPDTEEGSQGPSAAILSISFGNFYHSVQAMARDPAQPEWWRSDKVSQHVQAGDTCLESASTANNEETVWSIGEWTGVAGFRADQHTPTFTAKQSGPLTYSAEDQKKYEEWKTRAILYKELDSSLKDHVPGQKSE
jgi:hypothetical protein